MGRRSAWDLVRDPRTLVPALLLVSASLMPVTCNLYDHTVLDLPGNVHDGSKQAPWGAEITSLPGFTGKLRSKHYSGYLTVDDERGRRLFYYFVESERDPRTDPVVLWLNGGPGCSSFDGFMFEHGPFNFEFENKTAKTGDVLLSLNDYSWSKVASMLYVDSPAGVGLSYSETKEDYETNDTQTAHDLNTFLRTFFYKYKEFSELDFYITGESYAGVYVPLLAKAVLAGNDAEQTPHIHLKGYMIGNGVTDAGYDGNAVVNFAYFKSLIPADLFLLVFNECKGVYWRPPVRGSKCELFLNLVADRISLLNEYDILWPCYNGDTSRVNKLRNALAALPAAARRQWPLWPIVPLGRVPTWADLLGEDLGLTPPCLDHRELNGWLDKADVRKALHAASEEVTGRFQECTTRINYTHNVGNSMVSTHLLLNIKGLRSLIYSGDHDMNVPHTGTETWTRALAYEVEDYWRVWSVDGQVAGYTQKYKAPGKGRGLTYATVLGAGHFVPETRPKQALAMFSRFLADQPL